MRDHDEFARGKLHHPVEIPDAEIFRVPMQQDLVVTAVIADLVG